MVPKNKASLVDQVLRASAAVTGIQIDDLIGRSQKRHIYRARCATALALRVHADLSWEQVGATMNRTHSAVMRAAYSVHVLDRTMAEICKTLARTPAQESITPSDHSIAKLAQLAAQAFTEVLEKEKRLKAAELRWGIARETLSNVYNNGLTEVATPEALSSPESPP